MIFMEFLFLAPVSSDQSGLLGRSTNKSIKSCPAPATTPLPRILCQACEYRGGTPLPRSCAKAVNIAAGRRSRESCARAVNIAAGRRSHGSCAKAVNIAAGRRSHESCARAVNIAAGRRSHEFCARAVNIAAGRRCHESCGKAVSIAAGRRSHESCARAVNIAAGRRSHEFCAKAVSIAAGRRSHESCGQACEYRGGTPLPQEWLNFCGSGVPPRLYGDYLLLEPLFQSPPNTLQFIQPQLSGARHRLHRTCHVEEQTLVCEIQLRQVVGEVGKVVTQPHLQMVAKVPRNPCQGAEAVFSQIRHIEQSTF